MPKLNNPPISAADYKRQAIDNIDPPAPEQHGGVGGSRAEIEALPRHSLRIDGETYYEGSDDRAAIDALMRLVDRYHHGDFWYLYLDAAWITKRDG